jgi:hypothetical protein
LIHDLKRGFHWRIGANHDDFARHDLLSGKAPDAVSPIRDGFHNISLAQYPGDLT